MPIYAKPPGPGELHPEGLFSAVCVDVIDRGMIDTGNFGFKHKIDVRWLTSVENEDTGNRLWVNKRYTNSLHEKSNLRIDLQNWRGKKFTKEEMQRFDLETLIGKPCQVQIVHDDKESGAVYANVTAVLPAAKGADKIVLKKGEYVRVVPPPPSVQPQSNGPRAVNNGPAPTRAVKSDYDDVEDIPF